MSDHALHEVIVIPRNGYINRLQAWASASILGDSFDVQTRLLWEPEAAVSAEADELFDHESLKAVSITREEVNALLGCDHEQLPRYLHTYPERHLIVLAGHDQGEQAFMPQLVKELAHNSSLRTLVIIAGGQFHAPGLQGFAGMRREFYQSVPWNAQLDGLVHSALDGRQPFLAVHVRQTDRSLTAPTTRSMRIALGKLHEQTQVGNVFVAADSAQARDAWHGIARTIGLVPWSIDDLSLDRASATGGRDAMLDWRILGAAQGLVYSAESSFGHEAATVIGNEQQTIGLRASRARQQARTLTRLSKAALTYPRRHFGSSMNNAQD